MGTLLYGSPEQVRIIDDRALLHLQIVIIDKLRHGEHFAFSCEDDGLGVDTTVWMSPGVPLRFDFLEPIRADIHPEWLLALARAAQSPEGLRMIPEPAAVRSAPVLEFAAADRA